jgi:hypothetical protein
MDPTRGAEIAIISAIATQTPLITTDKAPAMITIMITISILHAPHLVPPSQCPRTYARSAEPRAGIMAGTLIAEGRMN